MSNNISSLCRKTKNPFNIRYVRQNNWIGQIGQLRGFARFSDMEYGIRAGIVLLRSYVGRGYNSVRTVLERYAPASENDTDSYVRYVSNVLIEHGCNPNFIKVRSDGFMWLCIAIAFYETNYVLSEREYKYIFAKYI